MKRIFFLMSLLAVVSACGSADKEDPILRLSAQESMELGRSLMENEKFGQAREYFQHAFEVEPNSAIGREALLLVADTLYQQGGAQNFLKAEAKYRDFQNRFPTSNRSDYVQFQIAASLEKRIRPPDRDQSITRKALEAFDDVIRVFPTSDYAIASRERIGAVRQTLAESEFLKGRFNQKLKLHRAAASRFEGILKDFPDYAETDKVLFHLIESFEASQQEDKAVETRERLNKEFPQSSYLSKGSD